MSGQRERPPGRREGNASRFRAKHTLGGPSSTILASILNPLEGVEDRASKVPRPAFRQKRGTERTGGLGISEHAVPVARAGESRALRLARAEPPKGEGSTRMLREVETRETVQGRIRDTTVKSQGRGTNSRHRLRPAYLPDEHEVCGTLGSVSKRIWAKTGTADGGTLLQLKYSRENI